MRWYEGRKRIFKALRMKSAGSVDFTRVEGGIEVEREELDFDVR